MRVTDMEIVDIKVDYAKAGLEDPNYQPTLSCFVPKVYEETGSRKRGAVVICPGGGYDWCSEREADPVAYRFLGAGFAAFVLRYSCCGKKFPTDLLECAAAVKYVRENAENFDIDPDKIFVMGFSAGGHLAASMANLWNMPLLAETLGCDSETLRVNGSVLCYPVILSDPKLTHEGSIANLLQHKDDPELREFTEDYHCTSKANPLYSMVRLEDIEALDRQVEVRRRKIIAADGAANYMRPFLNAHSSPAVKKCGWSSAGFSIRNRIS